MSENQESAKIKKALQFGTYELKGQFVLGSNYTFLASVRYEGETLPAVYKPSKGEQPLWDFPENTLALREAAAYQLSEALGWGLVPVTVYRQDGHFGPGSLQQYIRYPLDYHYFNFSAEDKEKLRPLALFDLLINNADRKGSHVFFEEDTRRLYAIDHGVCFHAEDKLRTVIWDFAGQPIPDDLQTALKFTTRWDELLADYLAAQELNALRLRAERLLASGIFPQPPADRRAFPYPPV